MIDFLIFLLSILGWAFAAAVLLDVMVFAMVSAIVGFRIPTRTEYREHALGAFLGLLGGVGVYLLVVIVCCL